MLLYVDDASRPTRHHAPVRTRRRGDRKKRLTLAANIASKDASAKVSVGPHTENPTLLTRMLDVASILGETRNARGVDEVSGDRSGRDRRGTGFLRPSGHRARRRGQGGGLGAIPRELKGNRAAEARRRSSDEGLAGRRDHVVESVHHPLLFADFSLREGVERFFERIWPGLCSYCSAVVSRVISGRSDKRRRVQLTRRDRRRLAIIIVPCPAVLLCHTDAAIVARAPRR